MQLSPVWKRQRDSWLGISSSEDGGEVLFSPSLLGFQEFGNPSEIFGSRYGAVNPGEEVLFLSISTARRRGVIQNVQREGSGSVRSKGIG